MILSVCVSVLVLLSEKSSTSLLEGVFNLMPMPPADISFTVATVPFVDIALVLLSVRQYICAVGFEPCC